MTRLFRHHSRTKRGCLAFMRLALMASLLFNALVVSFLLVNVAILFSREERFWLHYSVESASPLMPVVRMLDETKNDDNRKRTDIGRSSGMHTTLATPLVPMTRISDETRYDDNIEHPEIIRRSGKNWTLWDRKSVLHNYLNVTCGWTKYRPAHVTGVVPAAPMCVHRVGDKSVSRSIINMGRWPDCDALTPILQNAGSSNKTKRIHVEIGAHIGSCVMQVLLTTDAEVYAFEPHPRNLFHFTSTLMNMAETYRNRVHLFPIALAAESGFSRLVTNQNNKGNAQVQQTGATRGRRGFTIAIERLDDLLDMSEHPITLMKMDVQGYECKVLDGMKKTLQFTKNLAFEVEHKQLTRFKDCSPSLLVNTVKESGFTLYRMKIEGKDDKADTDLPVFGNFTDQDAIDLVAKRK